MTIDTAKQVATNGLTGQPNAASSRLVIGLAGWSGSGKTTLALKLIKLLRARGLRVATLKHAHHAFDVDVPGKDSFEHRAAGANEVLIASGQRIAHMIEDPLPGDQRRELMDLLERLGPVDVVLVEGFKAGHHPKIEVHRPVAGKAPLWDQVPNVVAIASPEPLNETGLPWLNLDKPEDWIDDLLENWPQLA